jgi:U3 small nucleolar RNA-associated protein 23
VSIYKSHKMRIIRNKHNRKTLNFYRIAYGFVPPYRLILDGNFIAVALKMQVDILRLLPGLLQQKIFLHVTECCLEEIKLIKNKEVSTKILQFIHDPRNNIAVIKCKSKYNHSSTNAESNASTCYVSLIGKSNDHKWFLCTQDSSLRSDIRKMISTNSCVVPLILFSQNVLILEAPTNEAKALQGNFETKKQLETISKVETTALKQLKGIQKSSNSMNQVDKHAPSILLSSKKNSSSDNQDGTNANSETVDEDGMKVSNPPLPDLSSITNTALSVKKKKRKGPKGPNPLSVKKKSKASVGGNSSATSSSSGTNNRRRFKHKKDNTQ